LKNSLWIVSLVLLLFFAFGCQKQTEKVPEKAPIAALTAADIVAIEALGPALDKAMLDGDLTAATALFTEDALVLPPNMPEIKTRAAFLDWIVSQKIKVTEHRVIFHDIAGCGDMAYARGTYAETVNAEGVSEPIKDVGKILAILRKQPDGIWLFSKWMWNTDLPISE
jgi:ketosteroid isomerase-like protein